MTQETSRIEPDKDDVKLSCRDLWKVYGSDPDQYFANRSGRVDDPVGLAEQIRSEGHIVAACDVSFDVHVGEIFVIMGLSGSGKSTVVRSLSRLVEPTAGEVILDDRNLLEASKGELIDIRRHKMGLVFQNFGLLPHLTVIENIAFPLKLQGVPLLERQEKAQQVIDLVGLEGRESSYPNQLSGGQQQRVGIARSLAVEPELWFLDEPFSALDPLIRRQMQDEFLRIQQMLHKSIVFITHDFMEALRIADRMAIMRDGVIVQMGTPDELVLNPANSYVAEFTSDVPWIRVLTAADIARPPSAPVGGLPTVEGDTTLEDLLSVVCQNDDGVLVTSPSDGSALGVITQKGLIEALAKGVEAQHVDVSAGGL